MLQARGGGIKTEQDENETREIVKNEQLAEVFWTRKMGGGVAGGGKGGIE